MDDFEPLLFSLSGKELINGGAGATVSGNYLGVANARYDQQLHSEELRKSYQAARQNMEGAETMIKNEQLNPLIGGVNMLTGGSYRVEKNDQIK